MKPPTIPLAKQLAYDLRAQGVIVLAFDGQQVGGSSFGHTRAYCDTLRAVLDQIVDKLGTGEITMEGER